MWILQEVSKEQKKCLNQIHLHKLLDWILTTEPFEIQTGIILHLQWGAYELAIAKVNSLCWHLSSVTNYNLFFFLRGDMQSQEELLLKA